MPETLPGAAAQYRDNQLYVEDLSAAALANQFGTPLYIYSEASLRAQYNLLVRSFEGISRKLLICYALKANANPAIGGVFAGLGGGADVVSGGEVYLARRMGFAPEKIVFAGVGKTRSEIAEALAAGVLSIHVESPGELDVLATIAADLGTVARVAVRVNTDVDAHTHPYITTATHTSKFGVTPQEALQLMRKAATIPSLKPVGLHAHVGSQLQEVGPVVESARRVLALWDQLAAEGLELHELDIGGGLGIPYRHGESPEGPQALASALRPLLAGRQIDLVLEPGRFLVGPAGVLLTRVTYLKSTAEGRSLAVVDAAMNDLLRPALYGAYHPIWQCSAHTASDSPGQPLDIVGPVCESSDVLGQERELPGLQPGDLLAIGQAGAYGFSMASQYNARPRPAEVLVSGSEARVIRRRETYEDLWPPGSELGSGSRRA